MKKQNTEGAMDKGIAPKEDAQVRPSATLADILGKSPEISEEERARMQAEYTVQRLQVLDEMNVL